MKCKLFWGTPTEAQDAFNKWAEGKAIMRDVIIHTVPFIEGTAVLKAQVVIAVYHPETPYWDSTKSKPIQRVQSEAAKSFGLEHKDDRILLAPIHEEPEPHIKVEEMQVSA